MPFQPGVSGNSKGRSLGLETWQSYPKRLGYLATEYSYEEILAFDDKIKKRQKVPLSTIDVVGIKHLAGIFQGEAKERERLLDRLLGKAVQRIGGENPGEGIKISAGFDTTSLDTASLLELAEAVERVKSRVIDAQFIEIPVPQLENPQAGEEQGE